VPENLELIADYNCEIGENPLWHPLERRLYWTDIPTGRLFRYDPATGEHEQFYQGRPVGGFTIQEDGSLLLFMDRGSVAILSGGSLKEVVSHIPGEEGSRFNDVIADPRGRVFCGTMSAGEKKGALYRLDRDGSIATVVEGVRCSNGLAFTPDRSGLYYADSFAYEIYLFDYDVEDGTLSNRRVFARFDESEGFPDGITVDAEGMLWVALWNGSSLVRFHPGGSVDRRIHFPARKTSSLIFAGDRYSDIYVTTAGGHNRAQEGELAGALFRLAIGTSGLPEFSSRVLL
jgi:D-xylonolactonase